LKSLPSLGIAGFVYFLWIYALPQLGGYRIRQQVDELSDGAKTLKVVKVPVSELKQWDRTHDENGMVVSR